MNGIAMTPQEIIDNYSRQLLPCPFCGGRAEVERVGETGWSPGCNDSNGTGDCIGYQALTTYVRADDAVKAWNKRAASVDAHPEGGDAQQAPFMSGAVPKADAHNSTQVVDPKGLAHD